jgi:hypothetical protein
LKGPANCEIRGAGQAKIVGIHDQVFRHVGDSSERPPLRPARAWRARIACYSGTRKGPARDDSLVVPCWTSGEFPFRRCVRGYV